MYKRADKNGDGSITFNEFLEAYSQETSGSSRGGSIPFSRKNPTFDPSKISQEAILRGCKYFWKSDKDEDGRLNHSEFGNMLQLLGMNLDVRSVYRAFRIVDVDDNNLISFGEFASVYMNEIKPDSLTPEKIKGVFYLCDKTHKGHLTQKEFQTCMTILGNVVNEEQASKLMERAAGGRDTKGRLSMEEYCQFLGLECEEGGGGVVRNKRFTNKDLDNRTNST